MKTQTKPKRAGNQTYLSARVKRGSRKIFTASFGGHQKLLRSDPRRRKPVRNEAELYLLKYGYEHLND